MTKLYKLKASYEHDIPENFFVASSDAERAIQLFRDTQEYGHTYEILEVLYLGEVMTNE